MALSLNQVINKLNLIGRQDKSDTRRDLSLIRSRVNIKN